MRKEVAIVIGAVIAIGAGVCPAVTFSTWDEGALRLELQIDPATRQSWLINCNSDQGEGGAVDLMLQVDGYSITSTAGYLSPALTWNNTTKTVVNGWFSIGDAWMKKGAFAIEMLGGNVAGFGRLSATVYNCKDFNIAGYAEFITANSYDPVDYPLDRPWSIGLPINSGLTRSALMPDIGFTYHTPTSGANWYQGAVTILPEPGCAALLLAGLAGLAHRRRRS